MDSKRTPFMRVLSLGGATVVGTLVFSLIYISTGSVSLAYGLWPVFAGGLFCSFILLLAAVGGSNLMERMRPPNDDEFVNPNYGTTLGSRRVGYGLWILYFGAGFMGMLFAGLFTPITLHFTIASFIWHILFTLMNSVVFTICSGFLMLMLERLAD